MDTITENHETMADGKIDIEDPQVLVALNTGLAEATMSACQTPYIAWAKVQKVLATYHIFIPNAFLEGSDGHEVIPINQFGKRFGQTNDGDFVVRDESDLFLYFEWEMNERGTFKVFAEIVNGDDLDEILDDYDEEVDELNESKEQDKGWERTKKRMALKNKLHDIAIKHAKSGGPNSKLKSDRVMRIATKVGDSIKDKKLEEDVINEVSKKLLSSYLKKAEVSRKILDKEVDKTRSDKIAKKRNNRLDSMTVALRKIGKPYNFDKEKAKVLAKEDKDPCWDNYEQIGMKKKGGKKVPNCVPVNEVTYKLARNAYDKAIRKGKWKQAEKFKKYAEKKDDLQARYDFDLGYKGD
jgi:hypothetical protein